MKKANNWTPLGKAARDLVAKLKVVGGEISGDDMRSGAVVSRTTGTTDGDANQDDGRAQGSRFKEEGRDLPGRVGSRSRDAAVPLGEEEPPQHEAEAVQPDGIRAASAVDHYSAHMARIARSARW
jgi:hypothetical protein